MATSYKTPGVYIEEIPKFPPSVAQVETAIPAFIGYTEKAEKKGESLANKATKISSLLEFNQYFGGGLLPDSIGVKVDEDNNYAVTSITVAAGKRYYLYDSIRLFYDNGGGDCYIISVGKYGTTVATGDENNPAGGGFRVGIKAVEKVDEPTILLFPDAVLLANEDQFYSLQQMALEQCAKLQDRVTVLDLYEGGSADWADAVSNFRNKIGINSLKYAMAYTPWIYTTYQKDIDFNTFKGNVDDSANADVNLATLTTDSEINQLVAMLNNAVGDTGKVKEDINFIRNAENTGAIPAALPPSPVAGSVRDRYKMFVDAIRGAAAGSEDDRLKDTITFVRNTALRVQSWIPEFVNANLKNDLASYATSTSLWRGGARDLLTLQKTPSVLTFLGDVIADVNTAYATVNTTWLGSTVAAVPAGAVDYTAGNTVTGKNLALAIEADVKKAAEKIFSFIDTMLSAAGAYQKAAQDALYEKHPIISNIVKNIQKELGKIPPSGAVAGIYARVDNARGVWKAPANESINSISGPVEQITHEEQSSLNVDAVAGKSINAIRAFTGKGTLIWGARTLAGNDNEWRYINVRRFFNMVEESSKKSTEVFVFEPNDANTWVKVQGMLENFLTTLWRQGALQGAKPEHAFYVAVGLGKTMTALDILEGRMIVEIGMAVVRPAEFILLRFSHKMAES